MIASPTVKLGIGIAPAVIVLAAMMGIWMGCTPSTPTATSPDTIGPDATIVEAMPPSTDAATAFRATAYCAALQRALCTEGHDPNCVAVVGRAMDLRLAPAFGPTVTNCLIALPVSIAPADVRRCGADCSP